jgi:ATP synthase I chain
VTTPAQDAPLVFPSVAFRPVRLFVISLAITAVAILAAGLSGHPMVGVFFGIGLLLGLLNALLVRRSVASITAKDHPLKSSMALNSASRLAIITILGLIIAYVFRPDGLGVVFGLALFQVLLVLSTALPVWKKLRTATEEPQAPSSSKAPPAGSDSVLNAPEGRSASDD